MFICALAFKHVAPAIRHFHDGWQAFEWMCEQLKKERRAFSISRYGADGRFYGSVDYSIEPNELEVWHSKRV